MPTDVQHNSRYLRRQENESKEQSRAQSRDSLLVCARLQDIFGSFEQERTRVQVQQTGAEVEDPKQVAKKGLVANSEDNFEGPPSIDKVGEALFVGIPNGPDSSECVESVRQGQCEALVLDD